MSYSGELRADTRDMALVHNMLRREFRLLPAAIRRVPAGDKAHAAVVASHIRMVYAVMAAHRRGTELHIWPLLAERVTTNLAPLAEKTQRLDRRIDEIDAQLTATLSVWEDNAGGQIREALAVNVERLTTALVQRLDLEWTELLPLVREYITQAEWDVMIAEGMSSFTKEQLPVVLGATIYEGDAAAVELTLAQLPPAARPVMREMAGEAYGKQALVIHGTASPPRVGARS